MSAAPTSSNKIVLQNACDGLDTTLLDRLLSHARTEKVISLSGHLAARQAGGPQPIAQDFTGAMRLVEQECYSAA